MGSSRAGGGSAGEEAIQAMLHVVQQRFPCAWTKAIDHFTHPSAHCRFRTREILYKLMRDGVTISEPVGRAMAARHLEVHEEELEMEDLQRAEEAAATMTDMPMHDGAGGRGRQSIAQGTQNITMDEEGVDGGPVDDKLSILRERVLVLEEERRSTQVQNIVQQSSRQKANLSWLRTEGKRAPSGFVVPHDRRMLQTRLDGWARGGRLQHYERLWARALYRARVPFTFIQLETTQELHDFMVSLMRVTIGPSLVLPSYTYMRTRLLDEIYHEIAERVTPKKAKWKLTGCTMMTDGATTRSYKPIVNFVAAGKDGPVLITTVDMSEREKTGLTLAELWEEVIRDINVTRVNAYCTDNAYAKKVAAQWLQDHADKDISRIPWLPCAAHCLSLLLRDITCFSWVCPILKNTHKVMMFFKNIHKALSYHRSFKEQGQLELIRLCDTRFGSAYQMVERLTDQERILRMVVGSKRWRSTLWRGKAGQDDRPVRQLVLSASFWDSAHRVQDVMRQAYSLLRSMDTDGSSPTTLWALVESIEASVHDMGLPEADETEIMERVGYRCVMMRRPAHALAYLVDPRRRDVSLLADTDSALVQSALHHLGTYSDGGAGSEEHTTMWYDLYLIHHDDPHADPRPKWWTNPVAIAQAKHGVHPAWWWYLHGGDFPRLQEVGIKVLAMWSTASPCERNWATYDSIHTKRRNRLSSDSLRKLVFILWNKQLLRARSTTRKGYADVWADMVEEPPKPAVGDPSEEVYAERMSIPEEVEADMRTRRKEGGDRASARLLQAQDDYDVEDEDVIYDADDVWAGKDMIEEIAAVGKGMEKVHDDPLVSRVWDRWGGLDVVEDLEGLLHGSRHTLHIMKDIEECRRPEGGSRQCHSHGRRVDTDASYVSTPPSTPLFGMPLDDGAARRPLEGPLLQSVAEEPCPDVGEKEASHDREEVCPGVDKQETTSDMDEQEEGAMTHEQPCLISEDMGIGQTEHASPAPTISEMTLVVGEGVRGRQPDHLCDTETGTNATAAHPRSTAGQDVMAQQGSEPDTVREVQTSVQPPPIAEHVAPASAVPPPIFESIEAHRTLTTMIGESLATAASSGTLRPTSFYTAPPLPVLHRYVVVRGPGLAIPFHSSSHVATATVGRLS
ncbi:hypothetical protein CBR_g4673 [Chara braunii]|uniref:DUF659 domain-containing protein n=1 Tax=Chara braunii TaxID=69332 RepID=A0A388KIQ0_CHABU|nr:hypothetical protein CBR_g4673 [Chara braunii]|eukprot:GBG69843.1 hypothetical protein CBR_g4673 [Chara braunii]